MRNKFADVIYDIGKKDKRICALVADISPAGSMIKFREKFPQRFINCGVAEQVMIGIAAGLALKGMRPFCYTIATFALYRPFEMVRVDLAYQNLPVTVIGMGAGLVYSTLGGTHQSFEDISIASSIPNMRVLAPSDPLEMRETIEWCAKKSQGPTYVRLGKAGEPNLSKNAYEKFKIDKLRYLKKGKDICILTYGTITRLSFEIADYMNKRNIKPSIVTCHSLKPLDKKGILKILNNYKKIIIIEENVYNGGLCMQIESLAKMHDIKSEIKSFYLKDKFFHFYGSYDQLLAKHGISTNNIIKNINL